MHPPELIFTMRMIGVGIALFGILAALPAIFNWDWFFELPFFKRGLFESLGRSALRFLYGLIGIGCIVTGILIAIRVIDLL